MKILIEVEFGYAFHLWDFPGTVDELIADWRAGRAPSLRPILATMPPSFDFAAPYPHFRGTLESNIEPDATMRDQADARIYTDPAALELRDGTLVVDPMRPPTAKQIAKGDISPLARTCVDIDALRAMLFVGPAPISWCWLMVHFTCCSACADKFRLVCPGVPIRMPSDPIY